MFLKLLNFRSWNFCVPEIIVGITVMESVVGKTKSLVKIVLSSNPKVDPGHNYSHALRVYKRGVEACRYHKGFLTYQQITSVKLACLLHDVDDKKFFKTEDYANARRILQTVLPEHEAEVIQMIKLVSCSENKNQCDNGTPVYMLYPRWCDRIDALGYPGIARYSLNFLFLYFWMLILPRCYSFTRSINGPLYTERTKRVTNEKELRQVAPPERFASYSGKSEDMMTHYYDKLVFLGVNPQVDNEYILDEFKHGQEIILNFLFEFGRNGTLDTFYLDELVKQYS